MTTDLLKDIVQYLVTSGISVGDGIDAFRDFTPDTPDSVIIIYEYGGTPEVPQIAGIERSIQISTRDKSASNAKQKAWDIYKALSTEDRVLNLTVDRWCMLYPRQTPFKIKVDNSERVYYGFNVGITSYID